MDWRVAIGATVEIEGSQGTFVCGTAPAGSTKSTEQYAIVSMPSESPPATRSCEADAAHVPDSTAAVHRKHGGGSSHLGGTCTLLKTHSRL